MRTKRYAEGEEVEMDFGGSSGTGEYAPEPEKKAKPAPRVVTKEELEKSGYTNLRDFLNAERGLKRRDDSAPERKSAPKAVEKSEEKMESAPRFGRAGQSSGARAAKEPDQEKMDMASLKRIKQREEMMNSPLARVFKSIRARGESGAPGYAGGGKVSSASKRADGIAQKGKTRGKMC
jgi:hypothetical protein